MSALTFTHENGEAPAPPHVVNLLLGSETHQHAGRANNRHREAANEGADHRVGEALQDHIVHSFPCAAGLRRDPGKPSATTMPDWAVVCGAGMHAALRNHLGHWGCINQIGGAA